MRSRPATHWCLLFVYSNPLFSMVPSFVPLLLVNFINYVLLMLYPAYVIVHIFPLNGNFLAIPQDVRQDQMTLIYFVYKLKKMECTTSRQEIQSDIKKRGRNVF